MQLHVLRCRKCNADTKEKQIYRMCLADEYTEVYEGFAKCVRNVLQTLREAHIFQNIRYRPVYFLTDSYRYESRTTELVKMAALYRSVKQFGKNLIFSESNRSVSLSATARLREIIEKKEDKVLTIEAIKVPQKKENLLLKIDSKACPLCATELDVKHTDVLILSQFLRSDGTMLPRRITGLCNVQQKRVSVLVTMAQRAGLLGRFTKRNKNGSIGRERRRFNTYYDEDTIQYKYKR